MEVCRCTSRGSDKKWADMALSDCPPSGTEEAEKLERFGEHGGTPLPPPHIR